MNLPDLINAAFEALGGLFILNHCRVLYQHKAVAGVSILSTVFFALWGAWNLYYYPSLDQWASFYGGLCITIANTFYIFLLFKYRTAETKITL